MEKNDYLYKGEDILNKTYEDDLINYNSVFICPYTVNNMSKFPFLQFLLIKNMFELEFIEIPIFEKKDPDDFLNFSKTILFNLLLFSDNRNDTNDTNDIDFKGYYEYNNNLYLFFDITKCELNINDIYLSNSLWLALVDEILNHRHLCNIKINKSITNFFTNNDAFCFLLNKENNSYEIPITGFVEKEEKKLNFTYIFGESRSDINSILGPFYYFTNFYEAFKIRYEKDEKEEVKISKNGLVRFALFSGTTKYIENHPNDKIDDSQVKQDRLKDTTLDQNMERLTMRITDYDGKWSKEKYDSVYLGNIELDNGTLFNKAMIVLKDYEQQTPLSYHYIDKKSYKERNIFLIT
jgi:hypothetical protein